MEPAAANGVSSNDYLLHPPPALNVVLLDISNLEIADQMYLYYELAKFFQGAGRWPARGYLSARRQRLFSRAGLYQRPELLLTALYRAIPRIRPDNTYLTDIDTLNQVARHLSELPGRKNVLWFGGGSTFYMRDDFTLALLIIPMPGGTFTMSWSRPVLRFIQSMRAVS